jgi:TonB family protein
MFVSEHAPPPIAVKLLDMSRLDKVEKSETVAPAPRSKPKPQKIIAPKLLSKPQVLATQAPVSASNADEKKEKLKTPPEEKPKPPPLPETAGAPEGGWNIGSKPGEAEGSTVGSGNLSSAGDEDLVGDTAVARAGGGQGSSGVGRGEKGDGTGGGGTVSDKPLSSFARPLGAYQVRPRYPDSARRAGAQGTTWLKLRILETGRVEEVHIEKSTGRRDLDEAAAEAVKNWLFEPARMGKEPVAVWVILPVEFKLHR